MVCPPVSCVLLLGVLSTRKETRYDVSPVGNAEREKSRKQNDWSLGSRGRGRSESNLRHKGFGWESAHISPFRLHTKTLLCIPVMSPLHSSELL
eukprot:3575791-Prymnesium_polylepis.1